jgi:hypothetical protein
MHGIVTICGTAVLVEGRASRRSRSRAISATGSWRSSSVFIDSRPLANNACGSRQNHQDRRADKQALRRRQQVRHPQQRRCCPREEPGGQEQSPAPSHRFRHLYTDNTGAPLGSIHKCAALRRMRQYSPAFRDGVPNWTAEPMKAPYASLPIKIELVGRVSACVIVRVAAAVGDGVGLQKPAIPRL